MAGSLNDCWRAGYERMRDRLLAAGTFAFEMTLSGGTELKAVRVAKTLGIILAIAIAVA